MATSVPTLAELIAHVRDNAGADDPLARLDTAIMVGERLVDTGDQLLDYFVAQARAAGCSWTVIGEHLGITKQAARKRFNGPTGITSGMVPLATPRLRTCLANAEEHASAEGGGEIGTQHLLAGLLAEGVAAAILERVGVTAVTIQASSRRLFGTPQPGLAVLELAEEAVCALNAATEHAARQQARCDDPFVGTEHLLSVLVLDPGCRARRVLNELDINIADIKRELGEYVTPSLRARLARRRRRPVEPACSFCRRPRSRAGRLVAGPGVWICGSCTRLAADAHRDDEPSAAS